MKPFDKSKLNIKPLSERSSKSDLSILIEPNSTPPELSSEQASRLERIATSIKIAKGQDAPIVFAFGAHLIKNGLSKILIELMQEGYVQHILGNGATSIHDWELAFQGKTEEDVEHYVKEGQFGLWEETGHYLNIAISENAELGYGTAVGKLIWEEKIGKEVVLHPHKEISIFGQAFHLGIPISVSIGMGQDIIHTHPDCDGAAIGEASYIDFLKFVETVSNLENGIYISVGSAITSPMVFEKALSMARNVALQESRTLENFNIIVNDIQPGTCDWHEREPPKNNPAYYLRFMKTFARMGGNCEYIEMDNRVFLHNLYHLLQ